LLRTEGYKFSNELNFLFLIIELLTEYSIQRLQKEFELEATLMPIMTSFVVIRLGV